MAEDKGVARGVAASLLCSASGSATRTLYAGESCGLEGGPHPLLSAPVYLLWTYARRWWDQTRLSAPEYRDFSI
eukprot:1004116-Rhodomonas_salina.2